MQIIDYVIIGFAVLFLIIGLCRGLVKMAFGLLAGLASLVIAIMLCTTVAGAIVSGTDWHQGLTNSIAGSVDIGAQANTNLVYDSQATEDVLGFYAENADGTMVFKPFKDIFEGNVFLQLLAGPIENGIISNYPPEEAAADPKPASLLIAAWLAVLVLQVICFFVIWILAAIVLKVISILLKKLVSISFVGHFFDRALGAVMGVGIAWIIVMVVFTVIGLMRSMSFMEPVITHIDSSVIGKLLYENNFIYQLVSANVDFSSVFGGASAASMALTLV